MKQNILIVQSYGSVKEYHRATLTILSFFCHNRIENYEVILFTDSPEWFNQVLNDVPVRFELLTPTVIKEMRGAIDFLHHMKIAMIDKAFQFSSRNIIYADSDSFFLKSIEDYLLQLHSGIAFMHKREYFFEDMKSFNLPAGKSAQEFFDYINNNQFTLPDGSIFKVPITYSSWNAGIMIFSKEHYPILSGVYALTDYFYTATRNHASEQYAFSIMLQDRVKLRDCYSVSYHYWYRVKKEIADLFLEKKFYQIKQAPDLKSKLDLTGLWVKKLPHLFANHYLRHRDDAIQLFNLGQYRNAYYSVFKALLRGPGADPVFIRDIAYHTRNLFKRFLNNL